MPKVNHALDFAFITAPNIFSDSPFVMTNVFLLNGQERK